MNSDMPTNLQAECPKCKRVNDYVFNYGLPKINTELTCGNCKKKFKLIIKHKKHKNHEKIRRTKLIQMIIFKINEIKKPVY